MKLRVEPVTLTVLSIVLGWAFYQLMDEPICQVIETHQGKEVLVPRLCKDVLTS